MATRAAHSDHINNVRSFSQEEIAERGWRAVNVDDFLLSTATYGHTSRTSRSTSRIGKLSRAQRPSTRSSGLNKSPSSKVRKPSRGQKTVKPMTVPIEVISQQETSARIQKSRTLAFQQCSEISQESCSQGQREGGLQGVRQLLSPAQRVRRFIIGLDYGTTFTSVSYYAYPFEEEPTHAFPDEVKSIENWPKDPMRGLNRQVPTESWYPRIPFPREAMAKDASANGPGKNSSTAIRTRSNIAFHESRPADTTLVPRFDNQGASQADTDDSSTYLWGYDVSYQSYIANSRRSRDRRVRCSKLMLVQSAHAEQEQEHLRSILNRLIENKNIRNSNDDEEREPNSQDIQDVISDFLVQILCHTKEQLVKLKGFTPQCPVSFVFTVPLVWSANSSRTLQRAMETAIIATGFCSLKHGSIDDLFIVSEPEAAANYLLGCTEDIMLGDTFVVLDCGGGTVDASSYTVDNNKYPLRLNSEIVAPDGDNCGASYLNDNFAKLLLERLADEHYLDSDGDTRKAKVERLIPQFEDYDKRLKDIALYPTNRLSIPGLRKDEFKRFEDHFILLDHSVLKGQLDAALNQGKEIRKVFLIGGFGAAPSLRTFLKDFLKAYAKAKKLSYAIKLFESDDQTCVTAIASGAVLLAMNKVNGPPRVAFSSYGFQRSHVYDPKTFPGHRGATTYRDKFDGQLCVKGIDYFITKNDVIPSTKQYEPIRFVHAFDVDEPLLLCEEVLWVSDEITESQHALDSEMNRGAQIESKIVTDMTFLKKGILSPTIPQEDANGIIRGKAHYHVEYELVPIVEGRNLRYEGRWPVGEKNGMVRSSGQISIASALQPGTA